MYASTMKINNRYEIIGLRSIKGGKYDITYLHTFGGKSYASEANAIRQIARKGFEYIKTNSEDLVVGFN